MLKWFPICYFDPNLILLYFRGNGKQTLFSLFDDRKIDVWVSYRILLLYFQVPRRLHLLLAHNFSQPIHSYSSVGGDERFELKKKARDGGRWSTTMKFFVSVSCITVEGKMQGCNSRIFYSRGDEKGSDADEEKEYKLLRCSHFYHVWELWAESTKNSIYSELHRAKIVSNQGATVGNKKSDAYSVRRATSALQYAPPMKFFTDKLPATESISQCLQCRSVIINSKLWSNLVAHSMRSCSLAPCSQTHTNSLSTLKIKFPPLWKRKESEKWKKKMHKQNERKGNRVCIFYAFNAPADASCDDITGAGINSRGKKKKLHRLVTFRDSFMFYRAFSVHSVSVASVIHARVESEYTHRETHTVDTSDTIKQTHTHTCKLKANCYSWNAHCTIPNYDAAPKCRRLDLNECEKRVVDMRHPSMQLLLHKHEIGSFSYRPPPTAAATAPWTTTKEYIDENCNFIYKLICMQIRCSLPALLGCGLCMCCTCFLVQNPDSGFPVKPKKKQFFF